MAKDIFESKARILPAVLAVALASISMPAAAAARNVYVANSTTGDVSVIDTATNAAIGAAIPVGVGPFFLAITPDGARTYVANWYSNTVSVIDNVTNSVATTVGVSGTNPRDVAISPDGSRVYVTYENSNFATVIDSTTNAVADTIPGVGEGGGIAIFPDGSRAYVTTDAGNRVTIVDLGTSQVVGSIDGFGIRPSGIAITPDGGRAYVANWASGTVSVVDTSSDSISGSPIPVGTNPMAVAISPDGSRAYVSNFSSRSVSVIDTATNTVAGTVAGLGVFPSGIALSSDGERAYVAIQGSNVSSVIDTSTSTVVTTIPTGAGPLGVAVRPNQPPVVSLTVTAGEAGGETTFDATGSSDPDGTVARYDWDFGDGTTLDDGGPTPTHVYQQAGTYTATVIATDDEGCSTQFVFTGQTALCNGSSVARKSVEVAVPEQSTCTASLDSPLVSVTHWRAIKRRLRIRLKADAGGYVLKSQKSTRFRLQVRRISGERNRRLRKVYFYLDGERVKKDYEASYTLSLDPESLALGPHTVKATAYTRFGTKHARKLSFRVSDCEGPAFSVGLSSKRPGTHPDLELRVRSGGSTLERVDLSLSRSLQVNTTGLKGRVGQIKLIGAAGTLKNQSLSFGRLKGGAVDLAGSSRLSVRLRLGKSRPTLSLKGLEPYGATGVRLILSGKRNRMVRNPASCNRRHKFYATITQTSGEQETLTRSLRMCRTSR